MPDKKYILLNQDIDTSFLTLEMTWRGIRDPRVTEYVGMPIPETFEEVIRGTTINTFMDQAPANDFIHCCADRLLHDSTLLQQLKLRTIDSAKNIRTYAEHHLDSVPHLAPGEMIAVLKQIRELQSECATQGTIIAFADILGDITTVLTEIVRRRDGLKHPSHLYIHALGSPTEQSLTERAYAEIRRCEGLDESLLKKYFWVDQGYIGRGLLLEELQSIRQQAQAPKEEDVPIEALAAELQLTPNEQASFQLSRDAIFIKSLRADSRQFLHVLTNHIIDRLATEWSVESKLLEALSVPELEAFAGQPSEQRERLASLWRQSVRLPQSSELYESLLDEEADTYLKTHLFHEEIKDAKELKGNTAHPGKVRGRVRLVFGPQHIRKVREGDILVSTATSPQLLPAMKIAAAYVTDVGGITSHAAIVARELKKPCIVGTKHATQILRDDDEVEVDAFTGTITILKRA